MSKIIHHFAFLLFYKFKLYINYTIKLILCWRLVNFQPQMVQWKFENSYMTNKLKSVILSKYGYKNMTYVTYILYVNLELWFNELYSSVQYKINAFLNYMSICII